ncbi:hypothetical protein MMC19_002680 [Ptychographa xylographoides]|nr:hypothetical protein [Ptychographa xylographoides]
MNAEGSKPTADLEEGRDDSNSSSWVARKQVDTNHSSWGANHESANNLDDRCERLVQGIDVPFITDAKQGHAPSRPASSGFDHEKAENARLQKQLKKGLGPTILRTANYSDLDQSVDAVISNAVAKSETPKTSFRTCCPHGFLPASTKLTPQPQLSAQLTMVRKTRPKLTMRSNDNNQLFSEQATIAPLLLSHHSTLSSPGSNATPPQALNVEELQTEQILCDGYAVRSNPKLAGRYFRESPPRILGKSTGMATGSVPIRDPEHKNSNPTWMDTIVLENHPANVDQFRASTPRCDPCDSPKKPAERDFDGMTYTQLPSTFDNSEPVHKITKTDYYDLKSAPSITRVKHVNVDLLTVHKNTVSVGQQFSLPAAPRCVSTIAHPGSSRTTVRKYTNSNEPQLLQSEVVLLPSRVLRQSHIQTLQHTESGYSPSTTAPTETSALDAGEYKKQTETDTSVKLRHDALTFYIPEAKLREAMLASRSTIAAYWQYSLYENVKKEKVKVHYCVSKETTERTARMFLDKAVIGFDVEWKPQALTSDGVKKNVSLIQMASEERIALFHIARYSKAETLDDLLAPTLKAIMENPNITKTGVSVKSDCTRLRKYMGIEGQGLFELSHLYKLVKFSTDNVKKIDKKLVALAHQVEDQLQLPLFKGPVRSSDWSESLNYQQIQYAASDSYAGLQLYHVMEHKRKLLCPTPPRPEHAELNLPIRLANGQTVAMYDEPEDTNEKAMTGEVPLPGIEEMARNFMQISIEDRDVSKVESKVCRLAPDLGKPVEVLEAEDWVRAWRRTLPDTYKVKASPATLRAYALWHHQRCELVDAARLLRNPPLQLSTVCGYIIDAVRIEKLPFDTARLREVFSYLPDTGRYQALKKQVA